MLPKGTSHQIKLFLTGLDEQCKPMQDYSEVCLADFCEIYFQVSVYRFAALWPNPN